MLVLDMPPHFFTPTAVRKEEDTSSKWQNQAVNKKKFNANRTSVRPPYQKSTVGAVKTVLRRTRWKSHLRTLKQVYIKSHTANMAGWDLVDLCFKMCLIRIWTLIGPFQSWKAFFCTVLLPILRPARGPSPIRRYEKKKREKEHLSIS